MNLKPSETIIPESFVVPDPIAHRREAFGHESIPPLAPVPLLRDKPRLEQDAQMLRHRRPGHHKMPGDRSGRVLRCRQQIKHPAPRGVADRPENVLSNRRWHSGNIRKKMLTHQEKYSDFGANARFD